MAYFTTKDNCKIYYEEHGSGEPLIFIHGWSCNHKFFKYQVDEFAKKYRVILYDFPDTASRTVHLSPKGE